jgi:hypothetical protein
MHSRKARRPRASCSLTQRLRTLENVYGAITYYLARQDEVERYLEATEAVWEQMRSEQRLPEPLTQRLERAKELNPHSS